MEPVPYGPLASQHGGGSNDGGTDAAAAAQGAPAPPGPQPVGPAVAAVQWTAGKIAASIGIFLLAGLAEIGGGWLVWQTVRNSKPWYYITGGRGAAGLNGCVS